MKKQVHRRGSGERDASNGLRIGNFRIGCGNRDNDRRRCAGVGVREAGLCRPVRAAYGPAYGYSGCYGGCSVHERLPDPELQYHSVIRRPQYYYVNQGPTYTGPGDFAPYPTYQEASVSGWDTYRVHPRFRAWRHHGQPILRRLY